MSADLLDMPQKRSTWTPKRIKELRLRLGLTQTEAAQRVEASMRSWQRWEAGVETPDRCHLRLIQLLNDGKL